MTQRMISESQIGQMTSLEAPKIGGSPPKVLRFLMKDSFGYLLSKIIPGVFGLISVPVFVRLIGVEEYGRFAVVFPVLMAIGGFGAGWLQQGILRFHPGSESVAQQLPVFKRAILKGTSYSALGVAVTVLPILGLLHLPLRAWIVAVLFCVMQLPYYISLTSLQARLQPRLVLKNEAVRSSASFLLPVALLFFTGRRSYELLLLGLGLGYALALLLVRDTSSQQTLLSKTDTSHDSDSSPVLAQLWRFGWAMGVWLMLSQALPVVGRSAIQHYAGYAQAGIYASLYELAVRCFSLFASPVMQAAHPRIMRHWNDGDHAAARLIIRRSIQIQTLMFLPVEIVGIAFAGPLTRLIVGPRVVAPISLFPMLMLGGFLWQIAVLAHKPLEIMQRTKAMLIAMIGIVALEFAGNVLLVPIFGMIAAVYVFLLGAVAYIALAVLLSNLPALRTNPAMTEATI